MKVSELEELIDEYGNYIYSFCLKLTRNKNLADELYQNTFLKATEKINIIEKGTARNYVIGIAVKLWVAQKRREAIRSRIAFFISSDDDTYVERASSKVCIEDEFIKKEEHKQLNKIIDKLNDKIRVVMIMFYGLEMSIGDIASALSIPEGTVKSRLSKGRDKVKIAMVKEFDYAKR